MLPRRLRPPPRRPWLHSCREAESSDAASPAVLTHRVYSMFSSMLHRNSTGSCDTKAARIQAQRHAALPGKGTRRTDGGVQPRRWRMPRFHAVEHHAPAVRRIERLQQVEQRGLAGAGRPYQRQRAARRRAQADAAQHLRRRPRRVRKVHLRGACASATAGGGQDGMRQSARQQTRRGRLRAAASAAAPRRGAQACGPAAQTPAGRRAARERRRALRRRAGECAGRAFAAAPLVLYRLEKVLSTDWNWSISCPW